MIRELRSLNPNESTAIEAWLIDFLACAGPEVERVLHGRAPATADDYARSISLPYTTRADKDVVDPQWHAYQRKRSETLIEICNALIIKVSWRSHPVLRALVLNGARVDKSDALKTTKNGLVFYNKLVELGSQRRAAAQESLVQEWALIFASAHTAERGGTRIPP